MIMLPSSRLHQCLGAFTINFRKGPVKKDFSAIYLITFFGVRNFRNTSAMRVIFYVKMLKI